MAAKNTVVRPPKVLVDHLLDLAGRQVIAKRLGWNEQLLPGEDMDLEPYGGDDGDDYPTDDLEGPLLVMDVTPRAGVPAMFVCLVGGQEADPRSIKEKGDAS